MTTEANCGCDGTGWVDCWACDAEGHVMVPDDDGTDMEDICDECDGGGGWPCQIHSVDT